MSDSLPPSIDPSAAARWASLASRATDAPWLHEEVAERMAERLRYIRLPVDRWADWEPERGGLKGHALVAGQYPDAESFEVRARAVPEPQEAVTPKWWQRLGRSRQGPKTGVAPPEGVMQMVWANMLAHHAADPARLLADWHRALAVNGFVMFSCLGPDTLRELRELYARLGWPPPTQDFTDMHDWGDLLVGAGFAEPVMDMERITLTFHTPERLLHELRGLGRNLHVARFPALRGRGWLTHLKAGLGEHLRMAASAEEGAGGLALSFEVIYGHALKPAPRLPVTAQTEFTLDDMKSALRERKKPQRGH
ncbi:class I SAM-dependent methyltransferase [Ottowia thiooxydans]|uniref:Malonyl-CoA O-methyltransferase n=1 Tax=Ottowia thiooxydans TaxID=219182 RepID=A0ABV2QES4_9BURK